MVVEVFIITTRLSIEWVFSFLRKNEGIRTIRVYCSTLLGKVILIGGENNNFLFSLRFW
mgnify:FL=1